MQLLFTTLALAGETLETGASRMVSLPSMTLHLCTRTISMGNCCVLDQIVATLESGLKCALNSWTSMEYNPVAILEEQQISFLHCQLHVCHTKYHIPCYSQQEGGPMTRIMEEFIQEGAMLK